MPQLVLLVEEVGLLVALPEAVLLTNLLQLHLHFLVRHQNRHCLLEQMHDLVVQLLGR